MANRRRRPLLVATLTLAGVWLMVGAGFVFFHRAKMTAEKVVAYLQKTDLAALTGSERETAFQELARRMNALPYEERRRARMSAEWERWFAAMTDPEKGDFIEATMPTGFKQMLIAFEQLSEDKRRRAISDSMRELRRARDEVARGEGEENPLRLSTNGPPALSAELQQKAVKIGLKTFYSESSAQSKAELAPLLEEMQRTMEGGALFLKPRRE
jgi:hypothetical protein